MCVPVVLLAAFMYVQYTTHTVDGTLQVIIRICAWTVYGIWYITRLVVYAHGNDL